MFLAADQRNLHVTTVQYLEIGRLREKVELFLLQLGRSKEEERLCGVGSFTKARWNLKRSGNGLWPAHRRPPGKGHLPLGKCQLPPLQDVLQA